MQRRKFMQFAGATAFALATGATVVTIDGCSINITDAINTVLNSAVAILKVAEPNASWTGLLASAIAALQQAETCWQSGGAAAIVVDALNTIEAVLAAVPENGALHSVDRHPFSGDRGGDQRVWAAGAALCRMARSGEVIVIHRTMAGRRFAPASLTRPGRAPTRRNGTPRPRR